LRLEANAVAIIPQREGLAYSRPSQFPTIPSGIGRRKEIAEGKTYF
jgi:hypothetical protein